MLIEDHGVDDPTTNTFKKMFEEKKVNFIFEGHMMVEGRTLSDYSIQKDSTISLTVRMKGGMPKRARPRVPEEQKLKAPEMRFIGTVREVPDDEISELIENLRQSITVLSNFKNNPNYLNEIIAQKDYTKLEEIINLMSTSSRGKANSLKMEEVVKILIPQSAGIESGITTLRSLYAQLQAATMSAIARSHHTMHRNPDSAEMDFADFKKSIEGFIKFKREQKIRDEVSNHASQSAHSYTEDQLRRANSYIESEVARRLEVASASASSQSEAAQAMDLS